MSKKSLIFAAEMQNRYTNIELLAPAKNLQVGIVAIDAGADAVYIGGPSFGARKAAGNSIEDIAALCRYAHFFRAKVLVTLNTLLREEEYQQAVGLAYAYKRIGVDAIIIQDLRLARMLFDTGDFSGADGGIRLHASTQCDNRNLERVLELEAMGFKRVVLARELSIEEMAHIRRNSHVELEAFVHGALCVSYSGACYMSEQMTGRSANRGECAQMCRLQYDVLDAKGNVLLAHKHILSLLDLDRSDLLPEMLAAGITTFKIEGRLKDADYVRNVVAYYRQRLDALSEKSSSGTVSVAFEPAPEKTFHRGRTTYFSTERPAHLVNLDTPKSTGELIGYAPLPQGLLPGVTLSNGDGLCYGSEGFYWPNPRVRIPAGTPIYRNYDAAFLRQLGAKDATVRTIAVDWTFEETPTGVRLTLRGDDTEASLSFDTEKQLAQNAQRAEEMVRQQLSKLGGTHLSAHTIQIRWEQPLFLPASLINDWRRQVVERFAELRNDIVVSVDANAPYSRGRSIYSDSDTVVSVDANAPYSDSRCWSSYSDSAPAMTCKYCILYELGCCRKQPHMALPAVPAYLRHGNQLFRIQTHCSECLMTLTAVGAASLQQ